MRKIKDDTISIDITGGVTFTELTNRYSEKVGELIAKYNNVHDILVTCESYEYNDGENYAQELIIHYKRDETDEEYKKRKEFIEFNKKRQEVTDNRLLKELIYKYPELSIKYINDLKDGVPMVDSTY
jgi:uncharacterized protein (DUF1330 family)